jgi:hypothetical protein
MPGLLITGFLFCNQVVDLFPAPLELTRGTLSGLFELFQPLILQLVCYVLVSPGRIVD